jgi:STE24 endopeptidase
MTPRAAAAFALVVMVVLLGAALWVVVPWQPLSVPSADRVAPKASIDFSAAEIDAGDVLGHRLQVVGLSALAVGLTVAITLGFWSWGAKLAAAAARPLGGGWGWQVLAGGLAVLLVVRLSTLPFAARSESIRRDVGLSTRSWSMWAVDLAKGFGVNAALTLTAVLLLVWLARSLPRWWWLVAAVGAAVFVVVVSFAYPLVVEPLFNHFTPMADGALRTSLLKLAESDGVAVDDVLVADASRRTSTLNAYVSGFGSSRRIVVYDTLLEQAPAKEVLNVVAHELGHAKENDVLTGTLLGALGAATAVIALSLVMSWAALVRHAGVTGMSDGRVFALILALLTVTSLATAPISNLVSRRIEARADVHALELTQDPLTLTQMQRRLALASQADLTPNWLLTTWFGSHPTTVQRLAAARSWAAANHLPIPPPLSPDRTGVVGSGP